MFLKSSFNYINEFYFIFKNQIRKIYLNSSIYNRKISRVDENVLVYQPSLNILSSLIKYEKQKKKIEDFNIQSIWENKSLKYSDFKKLHSFYWLFSIDLKSSNEVTQSIIANWIKKNQNYETKSWEIDILSKRVIAWISNSKITYDESGNKYKNSFNEQSVINARTPHQIAQKLIKEIPDWDINKLTKYMNHVAESVDTKAATPLKPLLKRFRANNIKLGVATNDGIDPAIAHLKSADILDLFDLVLGSDSGFGFKPGDGMLVEFCRKFKLNPSNVLMVGDSAHDLLAGKAANMRTIGVLTGIAKKDELMEYTNIVLNHIGEIPDFLIKRKFTHS